MTDGLFVEKLGPRLILTTFTGKVVRAMSEAASDKFQHLIATMDRPVWISDADGLTWFDPRTLSLGPRWFAAFRERGGADCLVVTRWNIAIMAATSMALGIPVRIHTFRTLNLAMAAAQELLAEP